MRRNAMVSTAIALAVILGGCGSSATVEETTTTVVAPTTTTTTVPASPEELREDFLAGLDSAGWVTYTDEVIGWSIRYPSGLIVLDAEPGAHLFLTSGDPATSESVVLFLIGALLDATPDDQGSFDYLNGNVEFAITDGTLRTPVEGDWFWLDLDFDDVHGPFDIEGVQASFAADLSTGLPLPADQIAPTWWYGYYNPDLRPAYGYIMQTIGVDPAVSAKLDDIVRSFEPPGE